jgi:uncharacterized protein YndB with AHSA1/START domain
MSGPFATLTFERQVTAPAAALWQAWTAPAARALWAAPSPAVTVEFLEADPRVGGREVSLCKVAGEPDIRCEAGWLALDPDRRSVNYEVVSSGGAPLSAALVTAEIEAAGEASRLRVTVQLSSLAGDMAVGYRQGFGAGLDNLADVSARTMVIHRTIAAPRAALWRAWTDPETLPRWWGPEGFTCRTARIDLRSGGEWVFDMIGPDGAVYPNHHRYGEMREGERIGYALLWGENGPKHADAWVAFEERDGNTIVTLGMVFSTVAEHQQAKDIDAVELGLQTIGKLARFVGAG